MCKRLTLYIKNVLIFISKILHTIYRLLSAIYKHIGSHRKTFAIGFGSLILITSLGFGIYKYVTTPRAPNFKDVGGKYLYSAKGTGYTAYIGNKENNRPEVNFTVGEGNLVFTPASGNENLSAPKTDGKKAVIFENVYKNIDYKYQTIPLGIKEEIIIKEHTIIKTFPFYLDFSNVEPQYYTDNLKGTTFFDKNGGYLFNFEKPYAIDANGARTDNVGLTIKKDTQTGKYVAIISLNDEWIDNSARVYPITIDPTIVHDESTEFSTGEFNRSLDSGSGSSPQIESYYQELATDPYTIALWHMNDSTGSTTVTDSSGNSNTGTSSSSTNVVAGVLDNARSFNGSSDYIDIAEAASTYEDFSIEGWFYIQNKGSEQYLYRITNNEGNTRRIQLTESGGTLTADIRPVAGGTIYSVTSNKFSYDNWSHIVLQRSANILYLYINGVEAGRTIAVDTNIVVDQFAFLGANTYNGSYGTPGEFFKGYIDETRVSRIARSSEEIALNASIRPYSTYTSDVMDLTSVNSWNSLYWNALGFATEDGETATSSATDNLVAQWDFNETNGTTATSEGVCGTSCNGTLTNMTTTSQDAAYLTGWTSNNKLWGTGALMFDGVDDYITIPNSSALDVGGAFSVEAWVKPTKRIYSRHTIFSTRGSGSSGGWQLEIGIGNGGTNRVSVTGVSTWIFDSVDNVITPGEWNHIVYTRISNSDTGTMYINGKSVPAISTASYTITNNTNNKLIGSSTTSAYYFPGVMDSVKLYSRALTTSEVLSNYGSSSIEFQTRVGTSNNPGDGTWEDWKPVTTESVITNMDNVVDWATPSASIWSGVPLATSSSTVIKTEGNGSLKVSSGTPSVDANTAALWYMDETGGSGAYIKDSTSNSNNGTPTGTTLVEGISDKARNFNGSSDYIAVSNNATLNLPDTGYTLSAWVNIDVLSNSTQHYVVSRYNYSAHQGYGMYIVNNGKVGCDFNGSSGRFESTNSYITDGQWYHLACRYDGSSLKIFVNGTERESIARSSLVNYDSNLYIGTPSDGVGNSLYSLSGKVDNIRISNTVDSAEKIAEEYRMGSGHLISKTILSTDLSSTTKLPFYIASDRLGTFSQLTIGESAYVNYESDENTLAFWHLDEQSSSSAYLKDSSGNSNHGIPTGIISSQGKVGEAKSFDASGDYITIADNSTLDQGNTFTISAWIYPNSLSSRMNIYSASNNNTSGAFWLEVGPAYSGLYTVASCVNGSFVSQAANYVLHPNQWNYVVYSRNGIGATHSIYVNGVQVPLTTNNTTAYTDNAVSKLIGARTTSSQVFNGIIDEVRIDNVVRTPDEIRQAYEIGTRTHNVTIDFKAKLDSDDFITGGNDTSFAIDETAYGSSAMANHLFSNDKIVVKENYDGTEYMAQGTVNLVNSSTGAVTVTSWDNGSTFPTGGFTVNATVFKWQKEYFDLTESLSSHRDAVTRLTYRITDGLQGANIWLDNIKSSGGYLTNPLGSTVLSSTGNRYFQYRAILSQNKLNAPSASLSSVTLDYVDNTAPETPILNSPTDTTTNQSPYPVFRTTATDNDSDNIQYKIQVCTDSAMTANCQTFDQSSLQTGWSGQNADSNTTYTSGTQATYTAQSIFDLNTTYYWRSYAIDPSGRNIWSSTQATPYSFTTSAVPNTPTLDSPTDTATGQALLPTLLTTATDSNSDFLRYKIELCTDSAMTANCQTFDQTSSQSGWSGQDADGNTTYTSGTQAVYTLQAALSPLTTYYWRSYAIDPFGANTWSSTQATPFSFTTLNAPLAATGCLIQENLIDSSLTIIWTDNAINEDYYEVQTSVDGGAFSVLDSSLSANTESDIDNSISTGHTYQYRVAPYFTTGPTYAAWCLTPILDLQVGTFSINGLNLSGLDIK